MFSTHPAYQRFFSLAVGISVLAEGRHIFGHSPKPRAAKLGEKLFAFPREKLFARVTMKT